MVHPYAQASGLRIGGLHAHLVDRRGGHHLGVAVHIAQVGDLEQGGSHPAQAYKVSDPGDLAVQIG
jgi:hypothetical protein